MRSQLLLGLAWANTALAHYRWTRLVANGTAQGEYTQVRLNNNYNSPVTDVYSNDIRCNAGAQANAGKTQTATVAAGSVVGFALDQAIYHSGVAALYMTKVDDPSTADGSTPWFKVAQIDPTFSSGAINFPANGLTQFTTTIPKSLPSGNYLLRVEHIALHASSGAAGAQFYISCAHLKVTGGGSGSPGPTVRFPGAYSASDPGILINIYYPIPTSYKYPGPSVWKG